MDLPEGLKEAIRNHHLFERYVAPIRAENAIREWRRQGHPVPPPHAVKQRYISTLADLYGSRVMVETGTNAGATVKLFEKRFDGIYSIEIYPPLARAAKRRFAGNPAIHIIEGDSAVELPKFLGGISQAVMFWLDGHYSGTGTGRADVDTPVIAELEHILQLRPRGKDVILVDDARCFVGANGYPRLEDFTATIKEKFGVRPYVVDDIIFILPS